MRPLPVIAIIREAYQFTFAHLGAIIGLIGLPMALVTVGGFFVEQQLFAAMQTTLAAHDETSLGGPSLLFLAYILMSILLYAMMAVPVAQLALGQRQGAPKIAFSFGLPEWRLFRALFGLSLFLLVPVMAVALGIGTMIPTDPAGMLPAQAERILLISLALTVGLVFVGLRFSFLLPALATTEEKAMLARSWALSAGNFWRIFAILAATVLVVFVVGSVLQSIVLTLIAPQPPATVDLGAILRQTQESLPLTAGFHFLMAPFLIGLGVSASAFSWRALTRTDISA